MEAGKSPIFDKLYDSINDALMIPILYQDEHIVIADKPSGLLVHPYWKETNEKECLMKQLRDQLGCYVHPAHRLDRPVSGPVIFSFNSELIKEIQFNWHLANTKKQYIAMVKSVIEEPGEFNFPLKNDKGITQKSRTLYDPLFQFDQTTLMKVEIKTGRKHQIRRHFSRRCQNVIGDTKRGNSELNNFFREHYSLSRIFLHCHHLALAHPISDEMISVHSPLPQDLMDVLQKMGLHSQELQLKLSDRFK